MKKYTLDQVQDKLIGERGTPERDVFEYELQLEFIGKAIKQTRQQRNLTQEELGKLIGVQKAQISRLENNVSNVTMDTLLRVFAALKANVKFQIELSSGEINTGDLLIELPASKRTGVPQSNSPKCFGPSIR
jgi:DNA-binding XRE family transcriptional regulator